VISSPCVEKRVRSGRVFSARSWRRISRRLNDLTSSAPSGVPPVHRTRVEVDQLGVIFWVSAMRQEFGSRSHRKLRLLRRTRRLHAPEAREDAAAGAPDVKLMFHKRLHDFSKTAEAIDQLPPSRGIRLWKHDRTARL